MSDLPGPESPDRPQTPFTGLGGAQPPGGLGDESDGTVERPRPGRMREQAPDSATPRPETVAEARARQRAQRERAEAQAAAEEQARVDARNRKRRRNALIGGGAVVGVVGVVALLYAIPDRSGSTTAYCTDQSGNVVSENYCSTGHINPLTGFILLNGLSYRYHYGGTLSGGHLTGGSYDVPNNRRLVTPSGGSIDSRNVTSFGAGGKSNVGTKNIRRGGLGAAEHGGSRPRSGGHGHSGGS
ncbi:hypothetical protein [Tsukamurella soli]|uniref:Uncharacterized protein n=1 Tax=Tsukamurella soli TaxID=644556 RepID=A0ABP8JTC1_9ACTN